MEKEFSNLYEAKDDHLYRRRKIVLLIDWFIWIVIGIFILLGSMFVPGFGSIANFRNVLLHSSILGILTIGETLTLLTGNFDLSIGSVLAFVGVVGALIAKVGVPSIITIIIMIFLGAGMGFLNGLLIRKVKLNAFIATLITMLGWRRAAMGIVEGRTIWNLPKDLCFLGSGDIGGFPVQIIIMLGLFVFFHIVLTQTKFGRHIYISGDNQQAAYNAGIDVDKVVILVFVLSGTLSAFSGLLMVGRLDAASPTFGSDSLFEAMSAGIIGGVSLQGGVGNLLMALGGVILLSVISNMLNLYGVSPYWATTVRAILLLIAVLLDLLKRRLTRYE